jgi:hypothetical protein
MGVMMGIIALALFGGGLFTWLGSPRKQRAPRTLEEYHNKLITILSYTGINL